MIFIIAFVFFSACHSFFNVIPLVSAYAQSDIDTVKYRNLDIDLGNGLKTKAQLTIPAIGKGPYPGVLLIQGSGALDMNETQGLIRIDNRTGSKVYPSAQLFFQISHYLSERGFVVLRYDKRGIGANFTILNSDVWGNATFTDLKQDAEKALSVLLNQPEVDKTNGITIIGHSEGAVLAPRVAIDNSYKVKNIILMGAEAQNLKDILYFQSVSLPLSYAEKVLDKHHDGLISLKDASNDRTFVYLVGGNFTALSSNIADVNISTNVFKHNNYRNNYILINDQLRPALIKEFENNIALISYSSSSSSSLLKSHEKCLDLSGCPKLIESYLSLNSTLSIIGNMPSRTGILILQGENDTLTPVEQAFLLQQRLMEAKHPDHMLITYPNLGHYFYPSNKLISSQGPMEEYVLQDMFKWLASETK